MLRFIFRRTLRQSLTVASRFMSTSRKMLDKPNMGEALKGAGFGSSTISTPSFGNLSSMPPPPDMDIDTQPATDVNFLRDLHGPWIVLGGPLQGELFIDNDGFVFYRPGTTLGQGIGTIKLTKTAAGHFAARIDLECYVYEQQSKKPMDDPIKYTLVCAVLKATARKEGYSTFTLGGFLQKANEASGQMENLGEINAAKMTPWDPTMNKRWVPDPAVTQAFSAVFQKPFSLSRLASNASPVDWRKYKLKGPKNVYYLPNYMSEADEKQVMEQLKATPSELKNQLDRRICQEYGCTMCKECNASFVAEMNIPPYSQDLCDGLVKDGVFDPVVWPNSVRIHEYEPTHGIGPHCEGPIYFPRVAIISFASPVVLSFYDRMVPYDDATQYYNDTFKFADGAIGKQRPMFSAIVEPRSLIIFDSDVYYFYPHGISDKTVVSLKEEDIGPIANRHLLTTIPADATELKRELRASVTIRNLLARCAHGGTRAEFCMKRAYLKRYGAPNTSFIEPIPAAPKAPPKATASPLPRPTSTQLQTETSSSQSPTMTIEQEIKILKSNQDAMLNTLNEILTVVSKNFAHQQAFENQVSTVMDHMSETTLKIASKIEQLSAGHSEKNDESNTNPS